MLDRRDLLLAGLASGLEGALPGASGMADLDAQDETIDLWPEGRIAGGTPAGLIETIEQRSADPAASDRAMRGIMRPRLVVFRPARPNGAAVLIMPGGGYVRVVIDKEGYETARWLATQGFTAFVLFYRLPGDGWRAGADAPLSDAQRAVRIIRARAAAFGIVPERIVALGFSAGGHVAGALATRHDADLYAPVDAADRQSARPMLVALLYAVQTMRGPLAHAGSRRQLLGPNPTAARERMYGTAGSVSARTPPCFLVHAEDDAVVPVGNTLEYRAACKANGVSVETHVFEHGGHGFGIRGATGKPVASWPLLFGAWMRSHGLA